ncbi:alpha/beta-hydrolase [Polyplosphaeria fusca]|uniref:Carboxylic ester hydrolase n=1 Tax=Polyplosphaeria fusca TaxID=682080 RepID=A0A9P4QYI9_9PLEO|nr:alpha/beta-hydrolase [Polyplosphaeria fusca]
MLLFVSVYLLFYPHEWRLAAGRAIPYSQDPEDALVVSLPRLGYLEGTQVVSTLVGDVRLQEEVDAWLGIAYAKQPVGELRFAPPEWPEEYRGTRNAKEYGPACIQNPGVEQDEACLYLNVFRTAGVALDEELPVLLWVHGGSFVGGSAKSFDGAAFVAASTDPVVVVTMNYRLGALGCLPSELCAEENCLNLGIQDIHLFLQFVQKYISYFGGSPDQITLGGQSAGAHAVGILFFHNYGSDKDKPLFQKVILSSGAATARAFPGPEYPLYERQFSDFMSSVDCPVSPSSSAMSCLRDADISSIQAASTRIMSESEYNVTWPWQPVSPGPLFEKRGSASGADGTFFRLPLLLSSTTDEGKAFAPQDLSTNAEFLQFFHNLAPGLTRKDLDELAKLYPDPAQGPGPYSDSPLSPQFERLSAAYGDYSYICPVSHTAHLLSSFNSSSTSDDDDPSPPVYKSRFNTPNYAADWAGVPHASDSWYFQGFSSAEFPHIAELYHAYYASFVVHGDPNVGAITNAPVWGEFGEGGRELVVGNTERGGVYMEGEGEGVRGVECAWWNEGGRAGRLNK